MRRREFIAGIAGMVAMPAVARAQERMRRIGILMNSAADVPQTQGYVAALHQGLQDFGLSVGRNIQVDLRWGENDPEITRLYATELVALSPDVIVAAGSPVVIALQRVSRSVPIVFAQSIDPVGSGIITSLSRPGGNATGFTQFEYGLSAKWVELLKEILPGVKRVGVLRDASNPAGIGQWAIIQAAATQIGAETFALGISDPAEIERAVAMFAQEPNGGLVVPVNARAVRHRATIIAAAQQHRLPAVYSFRYFVAAGGLASYGADLLGQYRRAASYVDRVLKGEKPADLPVQAPTKYELAVNLKTAKALGIEMPPSVLARADEVIE